MITILTGGTGGAKFVSGMARVIPADELTVIVNTGDDLDWWGLHVSPDLDSIVYALSGKLSKQRGWGYEDDSFRCLDRMRSLGAESWFQLGDLDLATHLRRTQLLSEGKTLSEVTQSLCDLMEVKSRILPMSDDSVETRVITADGDLSFQEYFVRDRWKPRLYDVKFRGAERAASAPGVLESIVAADAIFIAPSNPVTSIGPILSVPGVRDALRCTTAQIAAISPIVGGAAVSGPADKMMKMRGWPVSAAGVAAAYRDFADVLIADHKDETEQHAIESTGVRPVFAATIMASDAERVALANAALESISAIRGATR
jgi:LPPG:FO 2-phospho-L-lactate transferase